ncbi:MAG: chromosome segregation protein SMC [Rhizobiales bacterium]|nr:chromosome segregation protein SMC [Hyphomicrobiales bacterium]
MKFSRLRLSGFKSFVEPTEFLIEPGLTGVVGPNGCGKSNLLEALRWVMGENSYKSMRGSGMEDVIFNGSGSRPQRNMAEVTVYLDNSSRGAPAGFNDSDELEVSRRIEREAGSAYRINGKDARARDVQLLFADASTGSRSPALVRQGQISELINAKPQNRRRILEEAAGITGLHTRRHEAELKLNGAETNLTRLDDVVGQLEQQLAGLKRQARQAKRYRNLSGEIRKHEAAQLYASWRDASATAGKTAEEFDQVARVLGQQIKLGSEANRSQLEASEKIPKLRDQEMVRAAVVQRLSVERDNMEAEERRANQRRSELESRLAQCAEDTAREEELLSETTTISTRLDTEQNALEKAEAGDAEARAAAAKAMQAAAAKVGETQSAHDEANRKLSDLAARRTSLERNVADLENRLAALGSELSKVDGELETLSADNEFAAKLDSLSADLKALITDHEKAGSEVEDAEALVQKLRDEEGKARASYDDVRRQSDTLSTEVRTLTKMLNVADGELWPPLIDAVKVEPGYETALGAALGEDLEAAGDSTAPVHWDALPPLDASQPLPSGAQALIDFVEGPDALARRLSQVGIVAADEGKRLQATLKPGQRLVSREGDLWRWDGYTAAAEAPTMAARRLEERNRLGQLQQDAAAASKEADKVRAVHQKARDDLSTAVDAEKTARNRRRETAEALEKARGALGAHEREMADQSARASALQEARRRVEASTQEAKEAHATAQKGLQNLESSEALEQEIEKLRAAVEVERNDYAEARATHDGLEREAQSRSTRLAAIAEERAAWASRIEKASAQIETLRTRAKEAEEELGSLAGQPADWEAKRNKLMSALSDAEKERAKAADILAAAETRLAELTRIERDSLDALAETREAHARIEARLEAQRERLEEMTQRIADTLNCKPDEALELAGFSESSEMPDLTHIETKLEKLKAERERLGGVNLRAEEEVEEISTQIEELVTEREDVINAINKLRGAIGSLNREARQRLLDAFDTVNENFISLFTSLFGGGQAELKLTESDDPLDAGLEIFARPPGKRTQVMSLLSGGEQALTATALIFAVFLTNPSPICVLDEVDAPLDDANVERFCRLLEEMCSKSETRFLVITHHPLTMARMNRLFGVTMAEKGVSQLVSVSLEAAEQLREAS